MERPGFHITGNDMEYYGVERLYIYIVIIIIQCLYIMFI